MQQRVWTGGRGAPWGEREEENRWRGSNWGCRDGRIEERIKMGGGNGEKKEEEEKEDTCQCHVFSFPHAHFTCHASILDQIRKKKEWGSLFGGGGQGGGHVNVINLSFNLLICHPSILKHRKK